MHLGFWTFWWGCEIAWLLTNLRSTCHLTWENTLLNFELKLGQFLLISMSFEVVWSFVRQVWTVMRFFHLENYLLKGFAFSFKTIKQCLELNYSHVWSQNGQYYAPVTYFFIINFIIVLYFECCWHHQLSHYIKST